MYLKERLLISLNPQKFFLARSNAKSHHFFIWVVMFILTFFWVRKQYFPFPNTEILLTLEDAFNLQFVGYCPGAFCTL